MSINVDDMAGEIAKILGEYEQKVIKNIEASGKAVADQGAKKLKQTSPARTDGKLRKYSGSSKSYAPGSYAKSWGVAEQGGEVFGEEKSYTIYNKNHYRLTHLLENGHATRNGGRTRAIKHIEPAEQTVIREYESAAREAIEDAAR